MKTIYKISLTTYIFYLLLILSGYINYLVIYLFIVIFHEFGHIIMIKILGYKINRIVLYPTGAIIDTNINLNIKSNHLFLISIAGIINQIILMILIPSSGNYNYLIFKQLNYSLMIFNLLPLYPLDGYKIFLSMIERIFKYRISIKLSYIISYLFIFIFFYYTKNIYIFLILLILNINYFNIYNYYYNKFLLERYLYKYQYKSFVSVNRINDIYKNKYNYIDGVREEDYFDKFFF